MNLINKNVFDGIAPELFIEGFSDIVPGPLFVVAENGELLACNSEALHAASVSDVEELMQKTDGRLSSLFEHHSEYFFPKDEQWILSLGERMPLIAIATSKKYPSEYRLRAKLIAAPEKRIAFVYLEDVGLIQRAKKAERYFETFKQQFLTSISHEFRTPMNSIIGFSGLLEQSVSGSEQNREYVEAIQKSAGIMLENIENLLDLMQVESGSQKPKREIVNIYDELEDFFQHFYQVAEEKGVSIYFLIDPRLPEKIIADIVSLKKILRNLISNAIKFTAQGGQVLVEVKVVRMGSKPEVRYSVTDSGEGIEKERLHTILRPFAASRENQLQGKEGFGVGLTLAFKLLKLLRSELSVASEVGKGSRFSFTLKHAATEPSPFTQTFTGNAALWCDNDKDRVQLKILQKYLKWFGIETTEIRSFSGDELRHKELLFLVVRDPSCCDLQKIRESFPVLQIIAVVDDAPHKDEGFDPERFDSLIKMPLLPRRVDQALSVDKQTGPYEKKRSVSDRLQVPETQHSSRHILVAEDNGINQKLIAMILEQEGYAVTTADNGKIAVDVFRSHPFDLILMDIDMPVMDGISATKAIKEIEKKEHMRHTPVLALTARALAGDRERIIGAGLDAYLTKPVDRSLLLETLQRHLAIKDMRNKKMHTSI